jgi:hypothetical protein
VTSVTPLTAGTLAVGSRARIVQPKLPPAEWRVTNVDEGRGFTWVTGSPLVRVVARHSIEPTPAGSRVTLAIQFSGLLGTLVGWYTRDLNQRYLEIEAQGLKKESERAS